VWPGSSGRRSHSRPEPEAGCWSTRRPERPGRSPAGWILTPVPAGGPFRRC